MTQFYHSSIFLVPLVSLWLSLYFFFPQRSSKQLLHHSPVHVGQAKVVAGIAIRQFRVVEAQEVQQRGMQVVNVHAVSDRGKAEVVSCPVGVTASHSAPGQPHREPIMVVVSSA